MDYDTAITGRIDMDIAFLSGYVKSLNEELFQRILEVYGENYEKTPEVAEEYLKSSLRQTTLRHPKYEQT